MRVIVSQITSSYLTVNSGLHKKKHNSALLTYFIGNPVVTSGFNAQRASVVESVGMSWRDHETIIIIIDYFL